MKFRRLCALLTILAISLLGCSDDGGSGGSGGSSSAVGAVFEQICDLQRDMDPEGCPDDWAADIDDQVMFCNGIATVFLDTPECLEKAEAYLACAPEREWECWTGGSMPMPKDPDPCEDETQPFNLTEGECVDSSMISITSE
jgi:hypothetical protein